MASAGAHSNHVNHVTTQIPYAFTVAGVCAVGYLLAGLIGYFTDSPIAMAALPATLALLAAVILTASRIVKTPE